MSEKPGTSSSAEEEEGKKEQEGVQPTASSRDDSALASLDALRAKIKSQALSKQHFGGAEESNTTHAAQAETEEVFTLTKRDLLNTLYGIFSGADWRKALSFTTNIPLDGLQSAALAGVDEALKSVPDVITSYEDVSMVLPTLMEYIQQGIFHHLYEGQENANINNTQKLSILSRYQSKIAMIDSLICNAFTPPTVRWEEYGRKVQPCVESLSADIIDEMSRYIDSHPEYKTEHDTTYDKYYARQHMPQKLFPESVTPEMCAWYIAGVGRERESICSHCEKVGIPHAREIRATMERNGMKMKEIAAQFFPGNPLFVSSIENTEDATELPFMTKEEVEILLEGIITRLKDDEREKNPEATEEELEDAVAPIFPVLDVLKAACPDRLTRDNHGYLSRFVASSLQISVEIAEAGLKEDHWKTLTNSTGPMPPAPPGIRDGSVVLREAMQKVYAILLEKLGISTISREDLSGVLLRAQDDKDIIREDFPQELASIEKSDLSAFTKLSVFGERVKALDDMIAENLPAQAGEHMAKYYLVFCIKLRGILMKEMVDVKPSIRSFVGKKLVNVTKRFEAELAALFPETDKEQSDEKPEDESFGLEGEGPFDREELERAIILRSVKIGRSTGLRFSRSQLSKTVKRLCPVRIEKLSDVSYFMHWQRGKADAAGFMAQKIGTIIVNRELSSALFDVYNFIFERIGQRFGVEGVSLDRDCLASIAERSDNTLSAQEIIDVVTRSFDVTSRALRKVISKAAIDDAGVSHHRLYFEINANLQLMIDALSTEVVNQFPTGITSPDELYMLDAWFSEHLAEVIDESFAGREAQNRTYARLKDNIITKYWEPSLEHLRRRLTGESSDESFGLEGEGPFSREVLIDGMNRLTAKMWKDNTMNPNRQWNIYLRRKIKELCPETIAGIRDVSRIMHYLYGSSVISDVQISSEDGGPEHSRLTEGYYGPFFTQIGDRFGVKGVDLSPEGLRKTYERIEHVVPLQDLTEIVARQMAPEKVKSLLYTQREHVPREIWREIMEHCELTVKNAPLFLSRCLPEGLAAHEELELLDAFFRQSISVVDIMFESIAADQDHIVAFQKGFLNTCWEPMRTELEKRLSGIEYAPQDGPILTPSACAVLYAAAMQDIALTPEDAQALENLFASDEGEACIEAYSVFEKLLAPQASLSKDDALHLPQNMCDAFTAFTDALREADPDLGSRIADLYGDALNRFQESIIAHFSSSDS